MEWHDANSPHSFAYDNHLLIELVNSTVEDVSMKEGIAYASMAGVLERRIEASVDWSVITEIAILGLNEIVLKKGHPYRVREQLTAIFDMTLSKKQAQSKIRGWIQKVQKSRLNCFDDFLKLLNTWWEEITNYFIQRENSGFVEGLNNKVRVLK